MDAFEVYSSAIYKNDIKYLSPLLDKLEQPDVPEPEQKFTTTKSTDKDGKVTRKKNPTTFESAVYNEIIKNWIKATATLDSTLRSLYNIIWG